MTVKTMAKYTINGAQTRSTGRNLRDDVLALGSEEHDDGEDEADQRPRRNEADEVQLIVAFPEEAAQG